MTIIIYTTDAELSVTFHAKLLVNLCSAMLMALVVFILAMYAHGSTLQCTAWSIIMHYCWLSALVWMSIQGINLYYVVKQVLALEMESRYVKYLIAGWGAPLILVITSAASTSSAYGGKEFCWINSKTMLYAAFLMPLGLVLIANIVLFYLIVGVLRADILNRKKDVKGLHQVSSYKEIKAYASQFTLLGLAWVFGALVDTTSPSSSLGLQYLFAIFCAFQGCFLFFFQVLHVERPYKTLVNLICCRSFRDKGKGRFGNMKNKNVLDKAAARQRQRDNQPKIYTNSNSNPMSQTKDKHTIASVPTNEHALYRDFGRSWGRLNDTPVLVVGYI